jgi:hypothetical protein
VSPPTALWHRCPVANPPKPSAKLSEKTHTPLKFHATALFVPMDAWEDFLERAIRRPQKKSDRSSQGKESSLMMMAG